MKSIYAHMIYTGRETKKEYYIHFEKKHIMGLSKQKKGKLLGEFQVITPAFIDPHSHIGMTRAGEPSTEREVNEQMNSFFPLPDALDSVQMDDSSFQDAIEMGVLYSCILPGSGNIVGGLSAVIRHYSKTSTQALIKRHGVKAAFGFNPTKGTEEWKGKRPTTRMGALAILRDKLYNTASKINRQKRVRGSKKEEINFTAEENILKDILLRKQILRVHAHKIDDIASLLRIVDEFKIRVSVEHAGDVHQPEIFFELKKRKIPVVHGPHDTFAYKVELKHETWRNIKHLLNSKVKFGLMTDHPVTLSGQLFLQTRWFLRHGYTKQQAIELISRRNAEILELDEILGSLSKGKWASFTCWNGDPFDLSNYPVAIYGEGKLIHQESD